MRFLLLPLIGLGDPTQDSNFHVWRDFINQTHGRGHYFYMVVGDEAKKIELPELPNTSYVFVEEPIDFFYRTTHLPEQLISEFAERHGLNPIDGVLTSRAGISKYIQATMGDFRSNNQLPVMILEPLVRTYNISSTSIRKQMVDGYTSSLNWFLNEDEKRIALKEMEQYVSASQVYKALQNSVVEGLWVRTKQLKEVIDSTKKHEKFSVFWGGRISPDKRPEKMVELMEKFYAFGRDVRQVVTTHQENPHLGKLVTKASSIETLKFSCKRDEFLATSASCHMFLCTSDVEGFPTGFWEQLYLMEVGIFPDKKWVRANLPDNYPFIYKSMTEAHTMIRWIMENYEQAQYEVRWLREYIEKKLDIEVVTNKMMDRFEQYVQEQEVGKRPGGTMVMQLHQDVLKQLPDEFSLPEYLQVLEKLSTSYSAKRLPVLGYPTRLTIHKVIVSNGCVDMCNDYTPKYRKEV